NFIKGLLFPNTKGYRTSPTLLGFTARHLFGPELLSANARRREFFVDAWRSAPQVWSHLQKTQWTDLMTSLPDNLLVKADRLLMASSLEGRVPFLDHRIVEFGMSLPDQLKVQGKQGKVFLKQWAENLIPKEHLYAKKRGFHVPVGEWLQGEYRKRLCELLPQHRSVREWFRPAGVEKLLSSYGSRGAKSRMVWAMLQFAVWYELFIEGDGSRPDSRTDPFDLIA
ncbi:MAG: asparagine synthase C-terminal domain-containing protein, partial [Thermodesulfobacteriota bacterium]|nr:asparagine synthase C-terminal domain-containing protein [Thermodesulfobacteriota bacterium]